MRDDASWFAHWEDELPSPEELMPLSQTLITPDLAAAFDISTTTAANISDSPSQPSPAPPASAPRPASSAGDDFDSSSGAGDEPARTLKRPRLVWTPQLHKRFVDAVAHLGIKNAVPKTIMQLMNVDGLTRENVASHLQKYRLYLKRMQGLSAGSDGSPAGPPSAIDHLFASTPIPPHHHYENHHLLPFVPIGFNSPAATAAHHHHFVGGPPPPPAGYPAFDHRYLTRQPLVHHGLAPPPPPAGLVMSKTREFRGVEDELGSESTTPTTRKVDSRNLKSF